MFDHCIDLLLYTFENVPISVRGEIDFELEAKLEAGESIRIDNIHDVIRNAKLMQDPFMYLGETTLIEEQYDEPERLHYFTSKRSKLFTNIDSTDGYED